MTIYLSFPLVYTIRTVQSCLHHLPPSLVKKQKQNYGVFLFFSYLQTPPATFTVFSTHVQTVSSIVHWLFQIINFMYFSSPIFTTYTTCFWQLFHEDTATLPFVIFPIFMPFYSWFCLCILSLLTLLAAHFPMFIPGIILHFFYLVTALPGKRIINHVFHQKLLHLLK